MIFSIRRTRTLKQQNCESFDLTDVNQRKLEKKIKIIGGALDLLASQRSRCSPNLVEFSQIGCLPFD